VSMISMGRQTHEHDYSDEALLVRYYLDIIAALRPFQKFSDATIGP
jgi:hypothetical protein